MSSTPIPHRTGTSLHYENRHGFLLCKYACHINDAYGEETSFISQSSVRTLVYEELAVRTQTVE